MIFSKIDKEELKLGRNEETYNKEGISPLVFVRHQQNESRNANDQNDVQFCSPQFYEPSARQRDILSGYQGKVQYEIQKMQMDLNKQACTNAQRIELEEKIQETRNRYKIYLKMLSGTVYCNSEGEIIYAIADADGKAIVAKRLLNVSGFWSRIYVSYYPDLKMVLEVYWGNENERWIWFPYTKEGISPNIFLKKLKANGIFLLVSGKTEKDAANVLLAYAISTAENIEIPYDYGWGKDANLNWHYAQKDELVMKEMLKNE